jgi:hypothetical protein
LFGPAPQSIHGSSYTSPLTLPSYLSHCTLLSSTVIHGDLLDTRVSFHKQQQTLGKRHRSIISLFLCLSTHSPLYYPVTRRISLFSVVFTINCTKSNADYSACLQNALLCPYTTQGQFSRQRDPSHQVTDSPLEKGILYTTYPCRKYRNLFLWYPWSHAWYSPSRI